MLYMYMTFFHFFSIVSLIKFALLVVARLVRPTLEVSFSFSFLAVSLQRSVFIASILTIHERPRQWRF